MFSSINKTRLVAAAKLLAAATKNLFVVRNCVAVTKPFFVRKHAERFPPSDPGHSASVLTEIGPIATFW